MTKQKRNCHKVGFNGGFKKLIILKRKKKSSVLIICNSMEMNDMTDFFYDFWKRK